jgi:hypothetical protein
MGSEFTPLESFLNLSVESPDGEPISDPDELGHGFVSYFHSEIPEVFEYSPNALQAIDRYFETHDPSREFRAEFLFKELMPAMGGYLGETLIRHAGGTWVSRQPVLKSTVRAHGREIPVFQHAFEAVYDRKKLADLYAAVAKPPA